jgi:hypothetical protein
MKMHFFVLFFIVYVVAVVAMCGGCTQNQRAKSWGGNATVNLPKGQKLVNVTWKDSNVWYLTKKMSKNDTEEQYSFGEESSWGLLEGSVTIKEQK